MPYSLKSWQGSLDLVASPDSIGTAVTIDPSARQAAHRRPAHALSIRASSAGSLAARQAIPPPGATWAPPD